MEYRRGTGGTYRKAGLLDEEGRVGAGQGAGGHAQRSAQHGLAREPGAQRITQPRSFAAHSQVQRRAGNRAAGTPREVDQKGLQLLVAAHLPEKRTGQQSRHYFVQRAPEICHLLLTSASPKCRISEMDLQRCALKQGIAHGSVDGEACTLTMLPTSSMCWRSLA